MAKSNGLSCADICTLKILPTEEKFGLIAHMKRSAVSMPSNITEGRSRGTRKDFAQFLYITLGSTGELETQLMLAQRLFRIKNNEYNEALGLVREVRRMLLGLIASPKTSTS